MPRSAEESGEEKRTPGEHLDRTVLALAEMIFGVWHEIMNACSSSVIMAPDFDGAGPLVGWTRRYGVTAPWRFSFFRWILLVFLSFLATVFRLIRGPSFLLISDFVQ